MAKAEHIKKLIASFGRNQEFRAAAMRIIDEADRQGKKPLATSLRKILDANVRPDYRTGSQPGLTSLANQVDPATDLVDDSHPGERTAAHCLYCERWLAQGSARY